MKLYIPMAIGQTVPEEVTRTIYNQNISLDVVPCYKDGITIPNYRKLANREQHKEKVRCECNSRNLAIEKAQIVNDKYVAMQDRDLVNLYTDNYKKCIDFLDINLDYAGICMPWKDRSDSTHIRITAFVIRTEFFKQVQFRYDNRYHVCETWKEDILKFGKWEFLPSDKKLIIEV